MIKFTEEAIKKICKDNNYIIPANTQYVFFGIRGGSPANISDNNFYQTNIVTETLIDHLTMKCTIAQWDIKNKKIALYLGSTVPAQSSIIAAKARGGQGANQLVKGFYSFIKGLHNPRPATAHQAFVENCPMKIQRSADNLIYDKNDKVTVEYPWNNNHASWGLTTYFSSAGCQVVAGFPHCESNPVESGPWKTYRERAYNLTQNIFPYILFDYSDLLKANGVNHV